MQMQRDRFDIMIKSKSTQDQIASYLVKVVLGLRDKENVQESVRLLGTGQAISHVILVAEIIRARIKNVSSIIQFEDMEREGEDDDNQKHTYHIAAIRIKLTTKPTEEEKLLPGYQEPNDVADDKHVELFDYVMLYARNLYFWSGGRNNNRGDNNQRRNNHSNPRRGKDDSNRERTNSRQRQADPDQSDNWNKDREDFQQRRDQNMRQRGGLRRGTNNQRGTQRGTYRDRNSNIQPGNFRSRGDPYRGSDRRNDNRSYENNRNIDNQRNNDSNKVEENRVEENNPLQNLKRQPDEQFDNHPQELQQEVQDRPVTLGQQKTRGGQRRGG